MLANIVHITQDNFDEIITRYELVLLDFWGEKCAPCHVFARTIEAVAPDYPEVLFAKINTDEEISLRDEFQIRSIPFVMLIRQQVALYADSGTLNEEDLRALLNKANNLDMASLKSSHEAHD